MPKAKTTAEKPEVDPTVLVEVPVDPEVQLTDWGLHLDTKLSPEQSFAARRIAKALDKQQAKLANGRRVLNPTDAVRYLLERVGDG